MSPIDSLTEATRIYATNRFDFGREAGRVAGRRSRALVKALSSLAKRDVRASAIAAQASRQSLFAAQSELNEEIRGLAQALNMDAADLAATSALACSILVPGCTNFAAAPPATSDGQVMTSWNFDVPPYFRALMGRFPMFVREVDGTIPYLCMGAPPCSASGY